MTRFIVTERISAKIKGVFKHPGDLVELNMSNKSDKLIADQLLDSGTLRKARQAKAG